jgi:hypothetical protein
LARRSTATSCRSTSSSASLKADDRLSRTIQPQTRTKTRWSKRRDTDDYDAVPLARSLSQVITYADFWHPAAHQVGHCGPKIGRSPVRWSVKRSYKPPLASHRCPDYGRQAAGLRFPSKARLTADIARCSGLGFRRAS